VSSHVEKWTLLPGSLHPAAAAVTFPLPSSPSESTGQDSGAPRCGRVVSIDDLEVGCQMRSHWAVETPARGPKDGTHPTDISAF
jgi:hypothetical protein